MGTWAATSMGGTLAVGAAIFARLNQARLVDKACPVQAKTEYIYVDLRWLLYNVQPEKGKVTPLLFGSRRSDAVTCLTRHW